MDLKPGDQLGHFEILSLLGEGGMGVVYKARDPRLDRLVAIKLLTESRISDPDRRARFMQEARAASALNHPGIVTIHDIAEQDGRHYIVMEFVDGKPLNERIPRKGMGLTEGLRLAVQIADALAAAHAAGIVHRDIKPANIMVDPQGRTKVLDFGLAKLTAPTVEAEVETRTVAVGGPLTEEGTIVGSVPYMSPEQVEGRPLDARSDIFSFGAVLYEMFTGQRAFQGDSRISMLAAVVQRDPPPAGEVAPAVPMELERVISRCMRKDVARRSQNMSDVKLALEELRDESESGKLLRTASGISAVVPARRRWLWPAIAAACIAIAGAVVGWAFLRHEASAPISANMVRVSPDDGYSYHDPAISADGKFVAFISDRSGTEQLWLRQLGGGDPVQLTHSADNVYRAEFFPDGTRLLIATWNEQQQKMAFEIVPMLGGPSRVLLAGGMGNNEALSPDGHQVSYVGAGPDLTVIPVEAGAPRVLEKYHKTQPHMSYSPFSSWMPDGRALIVSGTGHPDSPDYEKDWDWFALPVDGGDPVPVGAGAAVRAARLEQAFRPLVLGDRIVFADGSGEERTNVWQIQFDPKTRHITGTPRQLTFGTEQEKPFSVSQAGTVAIEFAALPGLLPAADRFRDRPGIRPRPEADAGRPLQVYRHIHIRRRSWNPVFRGVKEHRSRLCK